MKLIFAVIIGGAAFYSLIKSIHLLLRHFFIRKHCREIDILYGKIHQKSTNEFQREIRKLEKWHEMDIMVRTYDGPEENIKSQIAVAQEAIKHEEQVYDKFIRLRAQYTGQPKKLRHCIARYKAYLDAKLQSYQDTEVYTHALKSGAITFQDLLDRAKQTQIVLEEFERKIDVIVNGEVSD